MTAQLTVSQAVAYAVMYALEAESTGAWSAWAHAWVKGDDRTAAAAAAAETIAASSAARHAAAAARLLAEADALQSEGALLEGEGRNAKWQLDTMEHRNAECLAQVAEALRACGADTPDTSSRAHELRSLAKQAF